MSGLLEKVRVDDSEILLVTYAGELIYSAPQLQSWPKDHQEGRALEIMYTFPDRPPYFVYYSNNEYYDAMAFGAPSSTFGIEERFDAERYRHEVSQHLCAQLLPIIYFAHGVNLSGQYNYTHNQINTNTIIFVKSLDGWYPIREAMNEGENAAFKKALSIDLGLASLGDHVAMHELSPEFA